MRVVVSDVGSQNMCDGGHVNCDLQVVLEVVFSLSNSKVKHLEC